MTLQTRATAQLVTATTSPQRVKGANARPQSETQRDLGNKIQRTNKMNAENYRLKATRKTAANLVS